jgi:hypothetical protein
MTLKFSPLEWQIYPWVQIIDQSFYKLLIDMWYDHELYQVYHIMEHQDLHKYVLLLDAKKLEKFNMIRKTKNFILPLYQI